MVAQVIGTSVANPQAFSPATSVARSLPPADRASLSVQALAGTSASAE